MSSFLGGKDGAGGQHRMTSCEGWKLVQEDNPSGRDEWRRHPGWQAYDEQDVAEQKEQSRHRS